MHTCDIVECISWDIDFYEPDGTNKESKTIVPGRYYMINDMKIDEFHDSYTGVHREKTKLYDVRIFDDNGNYISSWWCKASAFRLFDDPKLPDWF